MFHFASDYTPNPDAEINDNNPVVGYHNLVTASNISTGTANTDHPASDMANPATCLYWRGTEATLDEFILVNLGGGQDCDYIAVARHNFGTMGIRVSLLIATDGVPTYTTVHTFTPADDKPFMIRFRRRTATHVALILDQNGAGFPQAAVVYVGLALQFQRRIYVGHTPLPFGRVTKASNGMSESGHFLGRIVTGEGRTSQVSIQNIGHIWYRLHMEPFIEAAVEAPFFFAWRPSSFPDEVGYAWLSGDPRPNNQRANGMMQVALDIGGIVD